MVEIWPKYFSAPILIASAIIPMGAVTEMNPMLSVNFTISQNGGGGGEPGRLSQCITRSMRTALIGYCSQYASNAGINQRQSSRRSTSRISGPLIQRYMSNAPPAMRAPLTASDRKRNAAGLREL